MRIISKFRDYYDGGLAFGQDTSLTYIRETHTYTSQEPPQGLPDTEATLKHDNRWARALEFTATKGHLVSLSRRHGVDPEADDYFRRGWNYREGGIETGCVFFCGKQYPFYTAPKLVKDPMYHTHSVHRVFSWDKEFDGLVVERKVFTERNLGPYREVLEEISGQENAAANLHFRAPVVIRLGYDQIITNPCLTDYGFQRVIDPYTAFQEISMFLGGVLGQNMDPPSPMTDKEKVKSHGFDPKYGFRTPPGGKKRKG